MAAAMTLAATASYSASAQPVAAGFDPPLDREIRYEVVEQRHQSKGTLRFTLDERVVFTRHAAGYEMAVRLHSARSDAPPPVAQRFDGAFKPFVGMTTVLRLSPSGKPMGLADEAGLWKRIIAAVERLRSEPGLEPAVGQGIEAAFAGMSALPPAQRSAKLSEGAIQLLGHSLPPLSPGDRIETGNPLEGSSAQLLRAEKDRLVYALRTRKPLTGGAVLVGEGEAVRDSASGLLRSFVMRERLGSGALSTGQAVVAETSIRMLE